MTGAGQTLPGAEAQEQTALADAATAPYEAAGQAVATQGTTAAEMEACCDAEH